MKLAHSLIGIICISLSILTTSCRPEPAQKKTTCTSTVHGYTAPISATAINTGSLYTCTHGVVNTTSAAISSSGTFNGSTVISHKATFNTGDNCYYAFGCTGTTSYVAYAPGITLYKIDGSGTTTAYAKATGDTFRYAYLTYNRGNNKLYCVRTSMTDSRLVELTTGGSTFTATPLSISAAASYSGEFTVNNTTGHMYLTGYDTTAHTAVVYKYIPATGSISTVATGPLNTHFFELRYNSADNKLYGLQWADTLTRFVRIDPATGTSAAIGPDITDFNVDFYSCTLDPCNNKYIVSTGYNPARLMQFSTTSGALLQNDIIPNVYQGLDVQY